MSRVLSILVPVMLLVLLMGGGFFLFNAHQRHATSVAQWRDLSLSLARLEQLRRQHPVATTGSAVDGELLARIQGALGQVGLPASACTGVMPRGDEPLSGGSRRRMVAVTLTGLSIADLGGWLAGFRAAGNPWRIRELQCQAGGLDTNRYTVSLLLACTVPESAP